MLCKTRSAVGVALGAWLRAGLAAGLVACGSTPTPETPVAAGPSAVAAGADEEEAPSGPLEKVPAPAELFAIARVANPADLVDTVSGWIHIPIPLDVALEKELPSLRKQIALNAPIEVAASLDPDTAGNAMPLFAVSIPLKDYAAAVSSLRERGIGVERINRDMVSAALPGNQSCVVSRANGPVSARLICGEGHWVDVLAPYMARTLPLEPLTPASVYMEIKAKPLRERYGKQAHLIKVGIPIVLREMSLGNARFDSAVADIVHASATELLALMDEADKFVIKADTGAKREALHFDIGLQLNAGTSWTGATLNARAKDSAPAPEIVWRMPSDVSTAGYSVKLGNPEPWQPIMDSLSELLGGGLDYLQLKGRAYQDLVAAFRELSKVTGPSVFAKGSVAEASKPPNPALADLGPWSRMFESGGYALGGVEADGGRFKHAVDAFVTAYNDPAWRKELAKRADKAAVTKLPTMSKKPAPADLGLPKGSWLYEVTIPQALLTELQDKAEKAEQPATKTNLTFSMLLSDDGARTWVAYGADKAVLAAKLKQVLSGPAEQTLASRPGLEAWRREAVVNGGFWSVAELAESVAQYAAAATKSKGHDTLISRDTLTLAMPNKGKTPVLYSVKVEPGPTIWMSLVAPSQAMEDVAAGTIGIAAQLGDL